MAELIHCSGTQFDPTCVECSSATWEATPKRGISSHLIPASLKVDDHGWIPRMFF